MHFHEWKFLDYVSDFTDMCVKWCKWQWSSIGSVNSKIDGANMGPTWDLLAPDGPMLAPWTLLLGMGCRRTDDEKLTEPITGSDLLMHIYVPCSYTNHQTFNLPLYPKCNMLVICYWMVTMEFEYLCAYISGFVVLCCVVSCRVVSCRVVLYLGTHLF